MIDPTGKPTIHSAEVPDAIAALRAFEGAPSAFLARLLEVLLDLAGAPRGAILRLAPGAEDTVDVIAISPALPSGSADPLWLSLAAEEAPAVALDGRSRDRPLGDGRMVMVALGKREQGALVVALVLDQVDSRVPIPAARVFELGATLIELYDARRSASTEPSDALRTALEITAAMGEQATYRGAATALVNESARHYSAQRVALGMQKGRMVRLEAMSHTDKINRSSDLVRTIEAAMEETLDQDVELIAGPAGASHDGAVIVRDVVRLAQSDQGAEVALLPLRRAGVPVGVLCLERPRSKGWETGEIESARLACELVSPRLVELRERDRWIGAKATSSARRSLAWVIGAQYTWTKLLALALLALVLVAVFVDGADRAAAPFVVEAPHQRIVAAPFGGFLESASVLPGDQVRAGETVLATLATAELELQLAEVRARRLASQRQAAIARRESKEADAQIAEAQRDEAQAEIELLERQISRAMLVAPIDGLVVEQDLSARIGGAVRMGEPLFRIVPGDAIVAELAMPPERIAEIELGQRGALATRSFPERRIGFVVESIAPTGQLLEGATVFVVRARLEEPPSWLKPGMEGVAKVDLGRKTLGWLWTRRMVNWVRLKLWI